MHNCYLFFFTSCFIGLPNRMCDDKMIQSLASIVSCKPNRLELVSAAPEQLTAGLDYALRVSPTAYTKLSILKIS